ncbi:programmed cell death protein 5 [Ischnura elegans]|uniref:programmed cell death protein 5 n=1 Tax=Ischnura elegans TaxID=197161 RepID=UPI001ED86F67|nr:programmed cell death protein 5 [Ischnura elegans]
MSDPELEEIRAQRLAQLQSQYKGNPDANQKSAEERKREADEMRNGILSQVLTQSARARLNTLLVGKPEKGRLVENMLLNMARSGQLMGKLGEEELIGILEKVSEQTRSQCSVKFDRRRAALDDSDEDL